MKKFLLPTLSLVGVLVGAASAQTADEIVDRFTAAQKNVKDYSFKLAGTATFDGGSQKLDLDVRAIPASNLARIQFNAPDALADNIIVADKTTISTYLYLTNQITVQTVRGGDAGGLLNFDFSQIANASQLLSDNYNVRLIDTSGAAGGRTFVLEATAKDGGSSRTRITLAERGWTPTRIQLLNAAGRVTTDLTISNYKTNAGLTAARLRALPRDAEIVRR